MSARCTGCPGAVGPPVRDSPDIAGGRRGHGSRRRRGCTRSPRWPRPHRRRRRAARSREHVLLHLRNGPRRRGPAAPRAPPGACRGAAGRLRPPRPGDAGGRRRAPRSSSHPERARHGVGRAARRRAALAARPAAAALGARAARGGPALAAAAGFTACASCGRCAARCGADAPPLATVACRPASGAHLRPGRDEEAWLGGQRRGVRPPPRAGPADPGGPAPADGRALVRPGRLLLVGRTRPPPPALAAFHWTKVHGRRRRRATRAGRRGLRRRGRPGVPGRGLGRAVTLAGPAPPAGLGLAQACSTSTATTRRPCAPTPGWASQDRVDVMYSRAVHRIGAAMAA